MVVARRFCCKVNIAIFVASLVATMLISTAPASASISRRGVNYERSRSTGYESVGYRARGGSVLTGRDWNYRQRKTYEAVFKHKSSSRTSYDNYRADFQRSVDDYVALADEEKVKVLTPPYSDLALGKTITATATCGDQGEEETYCKLTGANKGSDQTINRFYQDSIIISGHRCNRCPAIGSPKYHSPNYLNDARKENYWVSPPISRSPIFNRINITISLGQEFHVAYMIITMANSPLPGVWAIDKSMDYGKTWEAMYYYAKNLGECDKYFGSQNYETHITRDDSVICDTSYSSLLPLQEAEVVTSFVNGRQGAETFTSSPDLQKFTKATDIRMRLVKTNSLDAHYDLSTNEESVTQRYYYAVSSIKIGGRCICNGHAKNCGTNDPEDRYKLMCQCEHNTCGDKCNVCCPGFEQKKWRAATVDSTNDCERCNCHQHSSECIYDAEVDKKKQSLDLSGRYSGGGVCQNCQDNTAGINCERCKDGYYRPYGVDPTSRRSCQRCDCDITKMTGNCADGTGLCQCRKEFKAPDCLACAQGYYDYPDCKPCPCNYNGTSDNTCTPSNGNDCPCKNRYTGAHCDQCDHGFHGMPECNECQCVELGTVSQSSCNRENGQCVCKTGFQGITCNQCSPGHFNYPYCDACNCDFNGCTEDKCDVNSGKCICKPGFTGEKCDRCETGYHSFPKCQRCNCHKAGSLNQECDGYSGQCHCNPGFGGKHCDQCVPGYRGFPNCESCNCDLSGTNGVGCDESGQCYCNANTGGRLCDKCLENLYNFPTCERCDCNPSGAMEIAGHPLGGCGSTSIRSGELCACKAWATGHLCSDCKPSYYGLSINNPNGCKECDCDIEGTVGGSQECHQQTGQCLCKANVEGRRCDRCKDGFFAKSAHNVFGCKACNCVLGGSIGKSCDQITGNCRCQEQITSPKCTKPTPVHYTQGLYYERYEMEEGLTPKRNAIRFGYQKSQFNDFSWKGYAIFNKIQSEVIYEVSVKMNSVFHIEYRYVCDRDITAEVMIYSEEVPDVQKGQVLFKATNGAVPNMVIFDGGSGIILRAGIKYIISLKTDEPLLVDYFNLTPEDIFTGKVLQVDVSNVCKVPLTNELCNHYVYVPTKDYNTVIARVGYVISPDGRRLPANKFSDVYITEDLGSVGMAVLNANQKTFFIDMNIDTPSMYKFVVEYHSISDKELQRLNFIVFEAGTNNVIGSGTLYLTYCPYSSSCRAVVKDNQNLPMDFDIRTNKITIQFLGEDDVNVALEKVIAVPKFEWQFNIISPQYKCIRKNKVCLNVDFESGNTLKIKFKAENGSDANMPKNLNTGLDTKFQVFKIDEKQPTMGITVRVGESGTYKLIVHYFQSEKLNAKMDAEINVNGKIYKGTVDASYCPSVTGCRALITLKDGDSIIMDPNADVKIKLTSSSTAPILLDHIIIVNSDKYHDGLLKVKPVDQSADYIRECLNQRNTYTAEYNRTCLKDIFTVVTDFNRGALPCKCNKQGSTSFKCSEFEGNCDCKPNVIGQRCTICRTGYWDYPNCKKCDCENGSCDSITGQCVCPANVRGAQCNACEPNSYGYDAMFGCLPCQCNPRGITRNRANTCDLNTGECDCLPNVVSRTCNKCRNGYYGFPHCSQCDCKIAGTTQEICNDASARCICKENTAGEFCDRCTMGTYNLDKNNAKGCSACFCNGRSTRCESSGLHYTPIRVRDHMDNVLSFENAEDGVVRASNDRRSLEVIASFNDMQRPRYLLTSGVLAGNLLKSYGAHLTFEVNEPNRERYSDSPVLKIQGLFNTLVYVGPQNGQVGYKNIQLVEENFKDEITNTGISKEEFLIVLSEVKHLHILLGVNNGKERVVLLTSLALDTATHEGNGLRAVKIEHCTCPPEYSGTSCESCARGFTMDRGNLCVACQCNGLSDTCDQTTGVCNACTNGFTGDHCEICAANHYLNTDKNMCLPCKCPTSQTSYADSCEYIGTNGREDRVMCRCQEGYTGPSCDQCDQNYYGMPTSGVSCSKCRCNGNVELSRDQRTKCDAVTGECLNCRNNAAGFNCHICREGFYGDAVNKKNCKRCDCDPNGSDGCNPYTGTCICKENVVGESCNECALGTFGFNSGNGCSDCLCGDAATSLICDSASGKCSCAPGVTGRRCDRCKQGFYHYTSKGCRDCECKKTGASTCDQDTGVCQCLPGVTGPKCNQCMNGWVNVPNSGCKECDSCVNLLLSDVNHLADNIGDLTKKLKHVKVSMFSYSKLKELDDKQITLKNQVQNMLNNPLNIDDFFKEIMDSLKNSLDNLLEPILNILDSDRTRILNQMKFSNDFTVVHNELKHNSSEALDEYNRAMEIVRKILRDMKSKSGVIKVDTLIKLTNQNLLNINKMDFEEVEKKANELMERLINTRIPFTTMYNDVMIQANNSLGLKMNDVYRRLYDLQNLNSRAMNKSTEISAFNVKMQDRLQNMKDQRALVLNITKVITDQIEESALNHDKAGEMLDKAKQYIKSFDKLDETLEVATTGLNDHITILSKAISFLKPKVNEVMSRSKELMDRYWKIKKMFSNRTNNNKAYNKLKTFKDIVEFMMKALENTVKAEDFALLNSRNVIGLNETVYNQLSKSVTTSNKINHYTSVILPGIEDIRVENTAAMSDIEALHLQISKRIEESMEIMNNLPREGHTQVAKEALERAVKASEDAQRTNVDDIIGSLQENSNDVDAMGTKIPQINANMRSSLQKTIDSTSLITEISKKSRELTSLVPDLDTWSMDLDQQIKELRERISFARSDANRIKVGASFDKDTILQVRTANNLANAGSHTTLKMYFRTTQRNGLLAYIGPDKTAQSLTSDYMSLQVIDGKVKFQFSLGSGSQTIIVDHIVNDGKWREVVVDRTGKQTKVTVSDNKEQYSASAQSPGEYSVLNLRKYDTKFYIGGAPLSAGLHTILNIQHFIGAIEDVTFNGMPIGLWNFVDAKFGLDLVKRGTKPRKIMKASDDNKRTFSGKNSFMRFNVGLNDRLRKKITISLKFKTTSPNALLIAMGNNKTHLLVSIIDGYIDLSLDYGLGTSKTSKPRNRKRVNDGVEHKLIMTVYKRYATIYIDSMRNKVLSAMKVGRKKTIYIDKYIYIGGYYHEMNYEYVDFNYKNMSFVGCLSNLNVIHPYQMKDHDITIGTSSSCSSFARTVSFNSDKSYVQMYPSTIGRKFAMTMRVKTTKKDGLLFYSYDKSKQKSGLSIGILGGKFVVVVTSNKQHTTVTSVIDTYADGGWHYISVDISEKIVKLIIDDHEILDKMIAGPARIETDSSQYFGGGPSNIAFKKNNLATDLKFIGCIGDITVNYNLKNFALVPPDNMQGVALSGCPIPDPIVVDPKGLNLPTGIVTNIQDEVQTESSINQKSCKLANNTKNSNEEHGTKFGVKKYSRFHFETIPNAIGQKSYFTMKIKTSELNGLIMYMNSEHDPDFIALYMSKGKLMYRFNSGNALVKVQGKIPVNDGNWHEIGVKRDRGSGILFVDNVEDGRSTSRSKDVSLQLKAPYFFGGISEAAAQAASANVQGITNSFPGCIKEISVGGDRFGAPASHFNTEPCSENLENGMYFAHNLDTPSYNKIYNDFNVALDLEIRIDIRPRSLDGVIVSVASPSGDFLVIQMINGEILFSANNGDLPIIAKYVPLNKYDICSGKWKSIKAVKAKNVLTLSVDGVYVHPGIGKDGVSLTNTEGSPLYIGGVPHDARHDGILVPADKPYVGCIRGLRLRGEWKTLENGLTGGSVYTSGCPIN